MKILANMWIIQVTLMKILANLTMKLFLGLELTVRTILNDLLEDGGTQDQEAFMDSADRETVFDSVIEPVPMSSGPYGHPTMSEFQTLKSPGSKTP